MTWPYPGDSPVARARRVAHAYRAALESSAPAECRDLDALMRRFGQGWVVPEVIGHDPDEWLSPADAAALACVEVDSIRQMRRRGILTGRNVNGRWEYRARDVMNCFAQPRGRNATVTVTLCPNGTSVSADAKNEGHRSA